MRTRRREFGLARELVFGSRIAANLMDVAKDLGILPGKVVAGYWPIGGEADMRPLLAALYGLGAACGLPVIVSPGEALRFREWQPGDKLESAELETLQPTADRPWCEPDIVLAPLLAFDRHGGRLGQGGGYYDRTLADLKKRRDVVSIGIGFSCQEVQTVPHGKKDMRLDWVVTEEAVFEAI